MLHCSVYWAKQGYVRICCALNTCMCCVYSHTSVDLNEYITVVSTSKKFLTAVCNKYNFKCKWWVKFGTVTVVKGVALTPHWCSVWRRMVCTMMFKSESMADSHWSQQWLEGLCCLRRAQESLDQWQTRLQLQRECQRAYWRWQIAFELTICIQVLRTTLEWTAAVERDWQDVNSNLRPTSEERHYKLNYS